MELIYVVVGGVIGLIGGLGTSWMSHRLTAKATNRSELLQAYAEWSSMLYAAAEAWKDLQLFDALEKVKAVTTDDVLQDMPTSLTGKTREQLVEAWLDMHTRLRVSASRVTLLEPHDQTAATMDEISDVGKTFEEENSEKDNPYANVIAVVGLQKQTEQQVKTFLRDVHKRFAS